jgi:hypothetical protein
MINRIAASPACFSVVCRGLCFGVCALLSLVLTVSEAGAVSEAVKRACANDYFAYCSMHPVGSKALRKCMHAVGPKLSKGCVNALVAAGEVSKKEVARRAAMR